MTAKIRDYYAAETEHLLSFGTAPAQVAAQLGIQPASLARALHRERRHDLAAVIERVAILQRPPGTCATCGASTSKKRNTRCRTCAIHPIGVAA